MILTVIDTETGGTDEHKHSILTLGVVVLDVASGETLTEMYYRIKDTPYNCEPKALETNGINLEEHDAEAMEPREVIKDFITTMKRFPEARWEWGRLTMAAHNAAFDRKFLERLGYVGGYRDFVNDHFNFRMVCSMEITRGLQVMGQLPMAKSGIGILCQGLGLQLEAAHNALDDARACAQLLTYYRDNLTLKHDWREPVAAEK